MAHQFPIVENGEFLSKYDSLPVFGLPSLA
jgi:hypothetical protein